MNDEALQSLKAALAAAPDSIEVLLVLARALLDRGEMEQLRELLAERDWQGLAAEQRPAVAEILIGAGRAEEALPLVEGDRPEALLLRARAHLELGNTEAARKLYRRGVEANPTLEDPDLAARLASRVRDIPAGSGRPKLRVISADDTIDAEAELMLVPQPETVDFSQVGGLEDIKRQIHKKIILPFRKPSLFRRFRKRAGGGILLYGPPGCGKTLLARATAGECNATFFNVAISDVLDMYIGESEQKLHALFEKARRDTPSVLFFDELEALGGKRQFNREAISSKLVSQFLAEMDGFSQNNQGVLILGATNVPWAVDAAFRRPGRFDRVLFVPPPDRAARRRIIEILLEDRPVAENLGLDGIARAGSGFSGADLENLVETATDLAIEESLESGQETPIRREHLKQALKDVRPTTLEWLTTARNYARYANEAGHYDDVLEFLRQHGTS